MSEEWEFVGEDGCPRCQALSGRYPVKPPRPHKYCNCEIKQPEGTQERDCFELDWDVLENNFLDVDLGEERHMKVRFIATCCDGRQDRTEIERRWTHEGRDKEAEMNSEIYLEGEDWAEWFLQNTCIGIA